GHRAEAARIEHVDLAARGGLRDRAREGLARCRAAARIGVVAHARDPRAGRLGVRRDRAQHRHADETESTKQQLASHSLSSSYLDMGTVQTLLPIKSPTRRMVVFVWRNCPPHDEVNGITHFGCRFMSSLFLRRNKAPV